MNCINCGKLNNNNANFCSKCGYRLSNSTQISNINNSSTNNKNNNIKTTSYYTIARTIIEFICSFVIFYLFSTTKIMENVVGLLVTLIVVAVYIGLSIVLNKFIKLSKFSNYMISNILSLLSSSIIGFITYIIYVRGIEKEFERYAAGMYIIVLVMYVIVVLPVLFIINLVIDLINNRRK